MERFKKRVLTGMLLSLPLALGTAYAAKPVQLAKQQPTFLQALLTQQGVAADAAGVRELSRATDFNHTLHVRLQQTYAGYDVYGADAILHIPQGAALLTKHELAGLVSEAAAKKSKMNGTMYQNLKADLGAAPSSLTQAGGQHAINAMVTNWHKKVGVKAPVEKQNAKVMVYVDTAGKAHWAYHVSFDAAPLKAGSLPSKPNFIVDAKTQKVYAQWDNIQTRAKQTTDDHDATVEGGGFGGNEKMGKEIYDGLTGDMHNSKLRVTRDSESGTCYMHNDDVTVKNSQDSQIMSFECKNLDDEHNSVYWNGDMDAVNGGYSPMNDALFGGEVIKRMYRDWYDLDVLTRDGEPMMLTMVVHAYMDNAYWDGSKMTFGDGISMFYPLTSLGVGAHEISHGFTQQHSNLRYWGQSGGMNEAFSDMAAQAAEYYAYDGNNSWQIGPEIFKKADRALRYMDMPSKDCNGGEPGSWCSIDDADQYYSGLDVHFSSGVYNRAFYLMGTAEDWNARKAFDVMVHANQNYWTSGSTFEEGACGVLSAATDLGYNTDAITNAFDTVKVDTSSCDNASVMK